MLTIFNGYQYTQTRQDSAFHGIRDLRIYMPILIASSYVAAETVLE